MASWYPANHYIKPHYRTMPEFLRIEDMVAPTLATRERKLWRTARDRALGQWLPVGFEIRARDARRPYGGNRVTLNIADNENDIGGMHCFEECPPCDGKSGCDWIHVDQDVWTHAMLGGDTRYLRYVIAHEFGHSLGFGHGGSGIMDATPYHPLVNDEEIAAAKGYWGIP